MGEKGDMLDARDSFATVVVKDSIYLIGGAILAGFPHEFLASVNVYDPQKDAWGEIPAMPIPLVPAGAAAVNGKIYVFGGSADVGKGVELLPDVVVYDIGFRAVTAQGKLPTGWGELKANTEINLKIREWMDTYHVRRGSRASSSVSSNLVHT